jgi:hypothetical protein
MKNKIIYVILICNVISSCKNDLPQRHTNIEIREDKFYINGKPTYDGVKFDTLLIEGLLMNSRMVQGIFDDLNPETRARWRYPDTDQWDPDRNTNEFVRNMQIWHKYGLLSFTINLQGGSPQGYSQEQPWHNSAYYPDGRLRTDYMKRLAKILDEADRLGMITILGLFYFGQDERLDNEEAVVNAVNNVIDWLFGQKYRNIIIEINNECNIKYDHDILKPERVHELIELVRSRYDGAFRYYAGTSYGGGFIPLPNVVRTSDFILLHGNGVSDPDKILEMVRKTREVDGFITKPILFNEDDHYDFEKANNNFLSALKGYASWGYFDYRREGESFENGYQSVPVDWSINSERKKQFFELLSTITKK